MKKYLLFLFLVLFTCFSAQAQFSLCGAVKFNDKVQSGAAVTLIGTGASVYTTANGGFCFAGLATGTYSLQATYQGVVSPQISVFVNDDISGIHLDIRQAVMDTVHIRTASQKEVRAGHSIKTEVIDLSAHALSSASVEQLMNRAPGIRIRNSGGLGGAADLVVGGFSGKSVKFLIDGIPMDYLGSSMNVTGLSSNMADNIEVYKGVLPTEIGIDALGGAINIVTKNPQKSRHTISYEAGSFNTHRVSFNSFIRYSDRLSYGINVYADYSANNFKVDNLPYADGITGRTEYTRARLFHNSYRQASGDLYLNFENRRWADLFKIKINSYGLKKDIQNDFASRARPFGGAYRKESAHFIPSVQYKKSFFDKRLALTQFLVYSPIQNELADTVRNVRYDWFGGQHPAASGSEMGTDMSNLEKPVIETQTNNFTYRGLLTYRMKKGQKLTLNVVDNYLSRTSDDLSRYHAKNHIRYNRFIAGLGYQYRFLNDRMEALTQAKYLSSQTSGEVFDAATQSVRQIRNNSGWSFAQSLKYQSYNGWLIRASAENTYRLPDQMEIFGDNVFIVPNLALKPEQSLNVNLGIRYRKNRQYSLEINTYWRDVKDMIRLKEVTQFTAHYLNLDKVRGYGIELEGMARIFKQWELTGNLTYNGFRFKGSNDLIAGNEHFVNARVSNMPFYFGNTQLAYRFDRLFSKDDRLRLYWSYTYVHQLYLDFIEKQFEPDGFLGLFGKSKIYTNRIIPTQQVHSAGLVWSLNMQNDKALSLSGELNNLFDRPIFNNFKMQSAGRNFAVKITYEL